MREPQWYCPKMLTTSREQIGQQKLRLASLQIWTMDDNPVVEWMCVSLATFIRPGCTWQIHILTHCLVTSLAAVAALLKTVGRTESLPKQDGESARRHRWCRGGIQGVEHTRRSQRLSWACEQRRSRTRLRQRGSGE